MEPETIKAVETVLGYIFRNKSHLVRALTRKAYAYEQRQQGRLCDHQEVYCTWGDAVLKLILIELLIQNGWDSSSEITSKKSDLENRKNLGVMPIARNLSSFMILGCGEKLGQVQNETSVIAETFEAVIAAIYQDGGFETTKNLVTEWFSSQL